MDDNISLLSSDTESVTSIDNDSSSQSNEINTSTTPVSNWWLDDKTPANGDVPDWFNNKKYKTVADQAKAQRELEKRLGGFTGAPEQYQPIEGIEADELYNKVSSIARELNMSNDAFNKLVSVYAEHNNQMQQISKAEIEAHKITEMQKLGVNAQDTIKNVQTWVSNNFTPEEQTIFNEFAVSADAIKILAKIKDMTGKAMAQSQPVANVDNISDFTESEDYKLEQMLLDPRYKTDAKYFDYVQERYKQYYG